MPQYDKTPHPAFDTEKVLLLSICHFVHDIYSSFLAPLLPFLIEKFGLSLTQAGFLSTVMQLPALLNPSIGKLADRISVRYFIILAPALTAIPMSLLGVAPSYGVLLILLFLTGISVSLFHVPAPVMVYRVAGERTGRAMSFYMTGGELARTLGPLTIIGAISLLGLDGFYPVMIVGIAVSMVMYLKFKDIPVKIHSKTKTFYPQNLPGNEGAAAAAFRHSLCPWFYARVSHRFSPPLYHAAKRQCLACRNCSRPF